jgi:hypothetical protein
MIRLPLTCNGGADGEVHSLSVCGATWWLGADQPVIGLTEHGRKPDIFWFNVEHEVAHIVRHPKRTAFLDRHATYKWFIGGSLRGTISGSDVNVLESTTRETDAGTSFQSDEFESQ